MNSIIEFAGGSGKPRGCVEIALISSHLSDIISRLPEASRKFLVVDVKELIVYSPSSGYYVCSDLEVLKEFVKKILGETKPDRVFICKGIDEKWIEKNRWIFLEEDHKVVIAQTLGRVVDIIPTKTRGFLKPRMIDPNIIVDLIALYSTT